MRRIILTVMLGCLGLVSWGQAATVTLTWDASARAQGYRLYYGQAAGSYHTVMDAGTALTIQVPGLTEGTMYYFVATAYHATGESAYSNEVHATTAALVPGDRTPPTVRLTSPGNGARVNRSTTITLTAYASDDVDLVSVEFLVNSVRRCLVLAVPYECRWDVPSRQHRTYTVEALATDTSGNIGHAATVRVTAR